MGRGVSAGGGQSSLGYLFGSGESPKTASSNAQAPSNNAEAVRKEPSPTSKAAQPVDASKQIPAGIQSSAANNHFNGQSTCNYITDRPSTKVHAAPGGGSSLDYLFGGGSK